MTCSSCRVAVELAGLPCPWAGHDGYPVHARGCDLVELDPAVWIPETLRTARVRAGEPLPPVPAVSPALVRLPFYEGVKPCVHRREQWSCAETVVFCDLGKGDVPGIVERDDCLGCTDRPVNVCFIGPVFSRCGGTETFHKTLLPRLNLDPRLSVIGCGTVDSGACDFSAASALGVPMVAGGSDVRALVARCDVVVSWGLGLPGDYLPSAGPVPYLVSVSHGDTGSQFSCDVMSSCSPVSDWYVAVDRVALGPIPRHRRRAASVIPNGVDFSRLLARRFRFDMRASLGLLPDDVAVLFMARLSEEKRPFRALEFSRLLPAGFVLLMVGDGLETEAVHAAASGNPRVKMLGKRDDVGDILAAADIFVCLSRTEGFGLSRAEAMAVGVPVVATPVGFLAGSPDLARIVGVDASAEVWASAVVTDWHSPTTMARVSLARETVLSRYSVDAHVSAWAEFLVSLCRSSEAPIFSPRPRLPL